MHLHRQRKLLTPVQSQLQRSTNRCGIMCLGNFDTLPTF
jgi:hypothetical protein